MSVGGILGALIDIWLLFSSGMSYVFSILNTPFSELLSIDIPVVSKVLQFVLDTLGIGSMTLLGLMFGAGISLMIVLTIGKWLIGIIT